MATSVAGNDAGDYVVAFTNASAAFDLGDGVPLQSGAYVARFDASHALVHAYRLGQGVMPTDVAIDPAGVVTVVGHFNGTVDLGTGPITPSAGIEGFLLRIDDAGALDALVHWGTDGSDVFDGVFPESVALGPSGETVVSGHFFEDVTFGGAVFSPPGGYGGFVLELDTTLAHVWSRAWEGRSYASVDVAANGDVVASAGWLTRLDGSGNVISDVLATGLELTMQRVAFDAAGNSLVVGYADQAHSPVDLGAGPHVVKGSYDGFVAKIDAAGTTLWSQQLGRVGSSVLTRELVVDDAGDVIVTGLAQGGTVAFAGPDILKASINQAAFLVKLAGSDGSHVWSKALFGPGVYDESVGTAVSLRAGNPIFVGYYRYQIDLGGGLLTCGGGMINSDDFFVGEYQP